MAECNGFIHPMGVLSIAYDSNPRYCHNDMYLSSTLFNCSYAPTPHVNLDMQMSVHNHGRMTKMLEALAPMDRKIEEITKFPILGSPNVMHPNERLMSSQAQLSFNHDMPPIQVVEPPVHSLDSLYDQFDLSWVENEFQTMLAQMPRFYGFNICKGNAHVQRFHSFMKKDLFREEDMCMIFFVRSLDVRAKNRFP